MFLPGNKGAAGPGLSPAKRVANYLRHALEDADAKRDKPALAMLVDNAIAIATNPNPKYSKEAIWAFRALFEYAYGQPSKSDEELDAMRQSGVQIAIVQVPGATVQVSGAKPAPKLLAPNFGPDNDALT
jgi:hypothetical protein